MKKIYHILNHPITEWLQWGTVWPGWVLWSGGPRVNRPFPSSPGLCFKTRVGAQPLIWKSFFILMQIKLTFTRKVVHLASFWKWGLLELGSGLFLKYNPPNWISIDIWTELLNIATFRVKRCYNSGYCYILHQNLLHFAALILYFAA